MLTVKSFYFLHCLYNYLISSYVTEIDDEDGMEEKEGEFLRSVLKGELEGCRIL